MLKGLNLEKRSRLLVGGNTLDDAAVYRLEGDLALVSTVDFFTPVVDDPRSYGRIAAANALSDVYAMGGKPVLALNLLCFSEETVSKSIANRILRGGQDKLDEAGVMIGGGHSVRDKELKYGLCVSGIVRRDRIIRNSGSRVGDAIVLTKPLGIGLMTTGLKHGLLKKPSIRKVTRVMEELNAAASRAMTRIGVNACTDITGFGFLGHVSEVAAASKVDMEFEFSRIPVMSEAYDMYEAEAVAGGLWTNKTYVSPRVSTVGLGEDQENILHDPQTSGGLLITLAESRVDGLLRLLKRSGVRHAARIGKVLAKGDGHIVVKG